MQVSSARMRTAYRHPRTSPELGRSQRTPPAKSKEKHASPSFCALIRLVHDALGEIIRHLGLIAGDVIVGGFQQLVLAIQQLLADSLLHARIGHLPLAARLLLKHLQ